ncbi:DNA-formamidopyrimidine glycosylase [Synechococcus sp. Cruz-9H2]|uniref:DNA-formamidopyrimidine glycosylase n=1 Tax=unclassified Synechococcus TaxID=2626047 RepID=UPI0020CC3CF8|nr:MULTISPECIES: DNA-formamidopyrimidine glycosylase [unclassified Synechococcus]MCP9820455.1 DNA-formamidopyrimidine glycosylase [Synechococcus sp. Cruz-9H2]MCP9844682.1 DNA-formamidopyrimidine glycosylase [Synechococcus sp. Edmonson 11F2]MCP9856885.1 DNA-formamidopyrimidine glycosylase [Synechococcus sp. Cruz-9C9]MCP9864090.1 DNA-formamidopyrimidine glycosylase [Synechococcus sp. Cruz-7E5]MCP9871285.1 DNA-formamidopyrimidine glycosylase [Synechococcus sp. Cruz-7B9]
MPELPEVETVRRGLERQLTSFEIGRVEVLRQRAIAAPEQIDQFRAGLIGTRVGAWSRRGKYLMAELSRDGLPAGHWGVHLRMTGQFLWLEEPREPCRHTRVRCWSRQGQELRFIDVRSFGQMWFIPSGLDCSSVMKGLQKLGPEPFSAAFSGAYLSQKLKGSVRPIKNALLDQALVAGVGNIYADESLFAAGLAPQRRSGSLSLVELERLRQSLIEVLEISIGSGGTTFSDFRDLSGTNGNYGGVAWVYRRGGQPCRRCGQPIQRERLGGRSSHWCPNCQR